MRLLTWNIRHGGTKKRAAEIEKTIIAHDPDIIVLTEFRKDSEKTITPGLHDAGWKYRATTDPPAKTNALFVASKLEFETVTPSPPLSEAHIYRWLELYLRSHDLSVLSAYIPDYRQHDSTGKEAYWKRLVDYAQQRIAKKALIIGDFNTGLKIDSEGTPFKCGEYMEELNRLGWLDSWRHLHPGEREFTWYSTCKSGAVNGFRLDYAYLSPPLRECLLDARHSHQEREEKLSDHSSLIVELNIESPGSIHSQQPSRT
jgi:exodeoxyribonuclease III